LLQLLNAPVPTAVLSKFVEATVVEQTAALLLDAGHVPGDDAPTPVQVPCGSAIQAGEPAGL
jgi:hypothetical protein